MHVSRVRRSPRRAGVTPVLAVAITIASLSCLTSPAPAQARCTNGAFDRLAFWLGEWEVIAGGRLAGTNRVTRMLGGCAIQEEWTSVNGGTGRSLFWVAPEDRRWRQVWVTAAPFSPGGVKEKREVGDAGLPAGAVRFAGTVLDTLGRRWLDRTTLIPHADGTVRQHIEISTDNGTTWRTTFDASYRSPQPVAPARLAPVNVQLSESTWLGRRAIRLEPDTGSAEPLMALLRDTSFTTGTIELAVGGLVPAVASATARGFVGVAMHVHERGKRAQSFYLRLTNGGADGQLQRNRAVQYQATPDFPWSRLRAESPALFETAADVAPGRWTRMKLVVRRESARLYLDGSTVATLVVNDLKTAERDGAVALWIGPETIGYFGGMRITADTTFSDSRRTEHR